MDLLIGAVFWAPAKAKCEMKYYDNLALNLKV